MTDRQQHRRTEKASQARRKAQVNRNKARQKLLQQRVELARRRAQNREQSETRRADDDSSGQTNPAAHSTVPSQNSNATNAARNSYSTVPPEPKYSDASASARLYGRRLHAAANRHGTAEETGESDVTDHLEETDG